MTREAMTERVLRKLAAGSLAFDVGLGGLSAIALVIVLSQAFAAPERSAGATQVSQPVIGELTSRVQEVRRRHDGTLVWFDAQSGDTVHEADAVYVGGDSSASIELKGGATLHLSAKSLVVVRAPASGQTLDVEVLRGGAVGEAGDVPLSLHTEDAAVEVASGAQARMSVAGEDTVVQVTRGQASLSVGTEAKGEPQTLEAGKRTVVKGGEVKATQSTFPALENPGPGHTSVRTGAEDPVTFRWESKPGTLFRLEIAKDESFEEGLRSYETPTPNLTVGQLDDGAYVWRVRAGDSVSEVRDVNIHTRPPPSLIEPRNSSVVDLSKGRPVVFSWTPVDGASKYRLEVARGRNFDAPILTGETRRSSLVVAASKMKWDEATYCYRVTPIGLPVLVSQIQCFRLVTRPVLRAPELFEPETDGDGGGGEQGWNFLWQLLGGVAHAAPDPTPDPLTLRWEAVPGATGYVLEIGSDADFKQAVLRNRVADPYFRWKPTSYAQFFWRVRAVDDLGREGQLSRARKIDLRIATPRTTGPRGGYFAIVGNSVKVPLEWAGAEELTSYEVQISRDATFRADTVRIPTTKRSHIFEAREVGTLHWRVVGRLSNGAKSPPSKAAKFRVVVAAPSLRPGSRSIVLDEPAQEVSLGWTARRVGDYQVQVSEDNRFSKLVYDQRVSDTDVQVDLPQVGRLYWRVRGRSPTTAWSSAGNIEVGIASPVGLRARVLETGEVRLSWKQTTGAEAYRVEMIGSESGTQSQKTDVNSLTVRVPGEQYRWSVVALGAGEIASAPSEPGRFEVGDGVAAEILVEPPEEDAAGDRLQLHAGPRLGFYSNVGAIATARVGGEVQLTLPRQPSLSVALVLEYFTATESASGGGTQATSRVHGVPLEALARYRVPAGRLFVEPVGGLLLTMIRTRLSLNGASLGDGGKALFGAKLGVSLVGELGPGTLAGELAYSISAKQGGTVEVNPSGLTLSLGYRFALIR